MNTIEIATTAQVELFGKGRLELMERLTTPDVIDHGGLPENQHGRDGIGAAVSRSGGRHGKQKVHGVLRRSGEKAIHRPRGRSTSADDLGRDRRIVLRAGRGSGAPRPEAGRLVTVERLDCINHGRSEAIVSASAAREQSRRRHEQPRCELRTSTTLVTTAPGFGSESSRMGDARPPIIRQRPRRRGPCRL